MEEEKFWASSLLKTAIGGNCAPFFVVSKAKPD